MTKTSFGDQLQQMWQTRPTRLPRHGPIAGVAAGFGHRYGIDPVLVRVAFVVSTIFGGAGIVLYLVGWLLFPEPGDRASMAESLTRRGPSSPGQTKTIVLIVALAIAVSTMGPVGIGLGGSGVISLALMLAAWWMLYLRAPVPPPLPPGHAAPEPLAGPGTTGYPGAVFPQGGAEPYPYDSGLYTPYTRLPDRYTPDRPPGGTDAAPANPAPGSTAPDARSTTGTAPTGTSSGGTVELSKTGTGQTDRPAATSEETRDAGPAAVPPPPTGSGSTRRAETTGTTGSAPGKPEGDAPIDRGKAGAPHPIHRTPPSWDPLGVAPLAWDLPEPAPTRAVTTTVDKRPRSRFTPVVLGLAILAAAIAGAARIAGAEWMTPGRIAAVALVVIGLGLVIGSFRRRGHGLLVVTAPLAAFVVLAAVIGPVDFGNPTMGDRTWAPASAAEVKPEYAVTMGSGTLDLRGVELTGNRTVDIEVQMGEAVVLVPENMNVRTECTVRMGDATCPDGLTGPGGDAPVLNLNVQVRMGNAEVRRG